MLVTSQTFVYIIPNAVARPVSLAAFLREKSEGDIKLETYSPAADKNRKLKEKKCGELKLKVGLICFKSWSSQERTRHPFPTGH